MLPQLVFFRRLLTSAACLFCSGPMLAGCGDASATSRPGAALAVRTAEVPGDDGDVPSASGAGAEVPGDGTPAPRVPLGAQAAAQPSRGDGLTLAYAGVAFGIEAEAAPGAAFRLVARPHAPTTFGYAAWALSTPDGCLAAERSDGGEVVLAACDDARVLRFEFFADTGYVFAATGAAHDPWFAVAAQPCRTGTDTCLQLTSRDHLTASELAVDAPAVTSQPARGVAIFALDDPNLCLRDTGEALTLAPCDPADAGQAWTLPFFPSSSDGQVARSGLGHCLDAGDPRGPSLDLACRSGAGASEGAGLSDGSLMLVVDGIGRYLTWDVRRGLHFDGAGLPPAFGLGPAHTAAAGGPAS